MNEQKPLTASTGAIGAVISIASALLLFFFGVEVSEETQKELMTLLAVVIGGGGAVSFYGRKAATDTISSLGQFVKDKGSDGSILTMILSLFAGYTGIDLAGTIEEQLPVLIPTATGVIGSILGMFGNLYRSKRVA